MENIDQKIAKLFEIVKTQREIVAQAEQETKQSWKTNCSITIGSSTPQNLQTANEQRIKEIVAQLLMQRHFSKEAANVLWVTYDDKYGSFLYDEWIADCKKRMSIINLKQKKDELNNLEERLNAIVSPEQKRMMEIESISKSLGL